MGAFRERDIALDTITKVNQMACHKNTFMTHTEYIFSLNREEDIEDDRINVYHLLLRSVFQQKYQAAVLHATGSHIILTLLTNVMERNDDFTEGVFLERKAYINLTNHDGTEVLLSFTGTMKCPPVLIWSPAPNRGKLFTIWTYLKRGIMFTLSSFVLLFATGFADANMPSRLEPYVNWLYQLRNNTGI